MQTKHQAKARRLFQTLAATLLPAFWFSGCGYGGGYGMGGGYGFGGRMMDFGYGGGFMGLLVVVVIAVVIYVLVRTTSGGNRFPRETPLDILKKRYANGEISKDEFEKMKADIQ